jgi:hypothetical protein
MGKRVLPKKSKVVSASEIGQYVYCSYAWQLRRMGYEPESPSLESGKQAHVALGEQIDSLERTMRVSRWLAVVGVIVLGIAFLWFVFGVIL